MELSIIILNYKDKEMFKNGIESILGLQLPIEHEIIAIDNHSQDGTVEMVNEHFLTRKLSTSFTFIPLSTNTGYTAGNNVGIRKARGKYVLIMNPDILYSDREDILKILEYMNTHTDVAIVGPKLFNTDESVQYSCFRFYKLFTPLYRRTFLHTFSFAKRDIDRYLMTDFDHGSIREVDWLLGSNMFVRKSVFDEVGVLDERFFLYFSDLEFCYRIWDKGLKVIYYPYTHITHFHKRESASSSGVKVMFSYTTRLHIKDWIKFLLKYKLRAPRFRPHIL